MTEMRTSNELAIVLRELYVRVRVVERELTLGGLRGVLQELYLSFFCPSCRRLSGRASN